MSYTVENYVNKIFTSVNEPFLSEDEKQFIPQTLDDLKSVFLSIMEILQIRQAQQIVFDKITARAFSEGVNLNDEEKTKKYASNIALGFGVDL